LDVNHLVLAFILYMSVTVSCRKYINFTSVVVFLFPPPLFNALATSASLFTAVCLLDAGLYWRTTLQCKANESTSFPWHGILSRGVPLNRSSK
jgi:hypothetical protein